MLQGRYIYPASWDGDIDGMTPPRKWVLNVTGSYDEDQEDVVIVDLSEMITQKGETPDRMVIEDLEWSNDGVVSALTWDRLPIRPIASMEGNGSLTWRESGGLMDDAPSGEATGDLMLTNISNDGDGNFSVTIAFRLKKD